MDNPKVYTEFLQLLNSNGRIIDRICCMYVDNQIDREDLKQEICLQLWRSFNSFQGKSAFSTWLYKVALNTALSFFRKDVKRKDRPSEECPEFAAVVNPEARQEIQEQTTLMYRAISRLPKLDRAIVALYLEEKNYNEISEILGITPVNARVRIVRIKERLRNMLNE